MCLAMLSSLVGGEGARKHHTHTVCLSAVAATYTSAAPLSYCVYNAIISFLPVGQQQVVIVYRLYYSGTI